MALRKWNLVRGGFLGTVLVAGALVGCNQGDNGGGGEGGGGGGDEESEFALPPAGMRLRAVRPMRVSRRVKRASPPTA